MFDIGRVCMKIAGRDAKEIGVVVDVLDKTYVLIDGQVRRKKCNMSHLEPLTQTVDLKKGASHDEVVSALKTIGIECTVKKPKVAAPEKTSPSAKGVERVETIPKAKTSKKNAAE